MFLVRRQVTSIRWPVGRDKLRRSGPVPYHDGAGPLGNINSRLSLVVRPVGVSADWLGPVLLSPLSVQNPSRGCRAATQGLAHRPMIMWMQPSPCSRGVVRRRSSPLPTI